MVKCWAELSCLNKLSHVGGGGWLEKLGIRLSQLPTKLKLKLKLKLSLAIIVTHQLRCWPQSKLCISSKDRQTDCVDRSSRACHHYFMTFYSILYSQSFLVITTLLDTLFSVLTGIRFFTTVFLYSILQLSVFSVPSGKASYQVINHYFTITGQHR